jgi:TolB protein
MRLNAICERLTSPLEHPRTKTMTQAKKNLFLPFLLIAVLTGLVATARAELEIIISGGSASAVPIAIVPLPGSESMPVDMTAVIRNDLARTGQFKPLADDAMPTFPRRDEDVRFGDWRMVKADYLAFGDIKAVDEDYYYLDFRLFDITNQKRVLAFRLPIQKAELRAGAHYLADRIYQAVLGIPGAFSTRIAYVTAIPENGALTYRLIVADSDGYNPQPLVTSREPLLSPAWSPDAKRLAYVSFEKGNSAIYIQNVATGERQLVSSFKGINGAPAFSPDGRQLAMTLSKGGNPDIYVKDLATGALRQITRHWAIDTEPAWSRDGKTLYFTSDRGGRPQIYTVSAAGGTPKRVTFEGDYNARAKLSPDGEYLATVYGNKNDYRIGVLHLKSGAVQTVSDGPLDESPSYAPNGSMILYAAKNAAGKGVLMATSADGQTKNELFIPNGSVREPAWSPLLRQKKQPTTARQP